MSIYSKYVICFSLILGLAGCSSDTEQFNTSQINIIPSLGRIQNADVRILDLDEVLIDGATGELDSSGSVILDIPDSFIDPVSYTHLTLPTTPYV